MSNQKQYINVVTNANQLRVDYQVLDDSGNILSNEKSIFLQNQDHLSEDAIFKIVALEQNVDNSHISTLLYNDTQKILNTNDDHTKSFATAQLNDTQSIACDKNLLFEATHYFNRTGVDYIFSPFSILYAHCIQSTTHSRLNVLILENKIYCMIINENNKVIFSHLKNMTSFEDIKNSDFYSDEIDRQKLFDEINLLEIQKYITEAIESFYLKHSTFITNIDILYTLKQLNKEHIEQLEHTFDMHIHYAQISIDESLYELTMHNSTQSFTPKREVPTQAKSSSNMTLIAVFTSIVAIALVYYLSLQNTVTVPKKAPVKKHAVVKSDLPNHINKNNTVLSHLNSVFDTIPYSMVIKELTLDKNNSSFSGILLSKNTFITEIKPQLLKLYANSSIDYEDISKKNLTNIMVENTLLKASPKINGVKTPEYIIDEFIPQQQIIEQIKQILPKNSIVHYKTKYVAKYTTFNFMINSVVQSPNQFIDILKTLNTELYSLHVTYPVNMRKTSEGIELNFILQFHQY
ncbi:MAG: hypothetical protein U9N30_07550 [Campylobacterota bacterium]|nr:hypothetical protein [Campylobacterota bacterium]